MSLQDVLDKVSYVNDNITKTVSEVEKRHSIKGTTATNGAEGTVSNKTQVTLKLLEEGGVQLTTIISKTINCAHNPTTVVENLHAFSHFKHETLTTLQYSQNLKQNGQPSILLMKNPTIVFPTPARSLQMSTLCDRYLQRRSTPILKML